MWLLYVKKFRDVKADETHAQYHAIREKLRDELRHPGRALDLKAKDLIGHLWVSLIIDQSECLVCFLFLHWINSFLYCLKKKPALLLTNQKGEIFSCILLVQIIMRLIWKQKIWLAICEFLWSLTNQNAWFVSSFCTELTLFCTV